MDGKSIKDILYRQNIPFKDIAERLGTSPQNFNNLLGTSDVKSGLIERLCDVLGMDITDFIPSKKVSTIEHSVSHVGNNNKNINNTTDASLLRIMERQSEQITTAQQQISDLIEILKKQ